MKITKKELNSIIQEEISNSLDEVDLRNFMRKGMEKLKTPFQGNITWRQKAGYEPSKPPPPVDPKRVIQLTAKFISQFQSELIKNKNFKETPLYKKVIVPLNEEITTAPEKILIKDLTRDIQLKKITIPEIVQSIQAIAKDPEFRMYITSLSDDAERVFGLETEQDVPTSQQPEEQPTGEPVAAKPVQAEPAAVEPVQADSDFDIDEGTPVEFAVDDLNEFLIDKGSINLMDLLLSDKGLEFIRKIQDDMLKSDKKTFEIFEQSQESQQLFITKAIEDLVGDDIKLKKELLELLLQWSDNNPEVIVNSQELKNELQSIQQAQPEEEPPELPSVQPTAAKEKQGQPTELSSTSNLFVKQDNYPRELVKYKSIIKPNNEVAFKKVMNFLFTKGLLLRPPEREMRLSEQEQQINNVKQPLVLVQKLAPEIRGQEGLKNYLMPLIHTLSQHPKIRVGYKDSFPIFWKLYQMRRLYLPQDWKQTISNPDFANVGEIDLERQRQRFIQDQPMDESLLESRRWQKLAGIIKD